MKRVLYFNFFQQLSVTIIHFNGTLFRETFNWNQVYSLKYEMVQQNTVLPFCLLYAEFQLVFYLQIFLPEIVAGRFGDTITRQLITRQLITDT